MMTTRKRFDDKGTEFGTWLRVQRELDSKVYGFDAQNLDYIWFAFRKGKMMLLEEKRHGASSSSAQRDTHSIVDQALRYACDNKFEFDRVFPSRPKKIEYYGYFLIQFQNTNPDDSEYIKLNGQIINKEQLIRFLKFDWKDITDISIIQEWTS